MKPVLAIIVALVFLPAVFSQEHAPTLDQCRADSAVWNAAVLNHNSESSKEKLPYDELAARQKEMHSCLYVDPVQVGDSASVARMDTYNLLESLYANEIEHRAIDFIYRHGLGKQFIDEDATGLR